MRGALTLAKPPAADGGFDVGYVGLSHGVQGAEAVHQAAEGALRVGIGGVLGQDGKGQFVDGVEARLFREGAVFLGHQPDWASGWE